MRLYDSVSTAHLKVFGALKADRLLALSANINRLALIFLLAYFISIKFFFYGVYYHQVCKIEKNITGYVA